MSATQMLMPMKESALQEEKGGREESMQTIVYFVCCLKCEPRVSGCWIPFKRTFCTCQQTYQIHRPGVQPQFPHFMLNPFCTIGHRTRESVFAPSLPPLFVELANVPPPPTH